MLSLLLVIELLIAIALIGVVLLQRSEGGALGMGGGGAGLGGLFSPRGASDALTRTTVILGAAFFIVSLALSLMVRYASKPVDPLDSVPAVQKVEKNAAQTPAKAPAPTVPTRQ